MSNGTSPAVVGEDARITGRFNGQDLVVFGQLEGEVELKGRLRVGKQGRVKAKVKAAATEIEGDFEGEVRTDALTLTETARARGTFVAKRLDVREGAVLEGSVNPAGSAAAGSTAPPKPAPEPGPPPAPVSSAAAAPAPPAGPAPAGTPPATGGSGPENKPGDGGKTP